VVSGQAFEHIEFIWLTILEIARVLKTNGLAVIIARRGVTSIAILPIAGASIRTAFLPLSSTRASS
jgi:hypothetical protein